MEGDEKFTAKTLTRRDEGLTAKKQRTQRVFVNHEETEVNGGYGALVPCSTRNYGWNRALAIWSYKN